MTPAVLESPVAPSASVQPTRESLSKDAILSIEQAAELLGETLRGVRDLTSIGLLKYQLIDGERCTWLSDLIAYKRDFERARAKWEADPLNTPVMKRLIPSMCFPSMPTC